MSPVPSASIIILTWNSGAHMEKFHPALLKQTWRDFEIVLVDNGSTDGSVGEIEDWWKEFSFVAERLQSNLGFAAANNIGARLARGKWIVLLNADAYPEPSWLENLVNAAEANPGFTAFSSRQIQFDLPQLLDGAGDAYHISGLAWRNQYNLPADKYGLEKSEIFSPCAAAAMYSREEFLKLAGLMRIISRISKTWIWGSVSASTEGGVCMFLTPSSTMWAVQALAGAATFPFIMAIAT